MRIWVLGSISILGLAFSPAARSAPDLEEAAPPGPAAKEPGTAPSATTAPPATTAPSPPPQPAAAPDAAPPSPKPLTGPITGPLPPEPPEPPEASLPPLPASADSVENAPPAPPPPPRARRRSEWGVQLRLEAAPMSNDASPDAGMGGIGFSLRPRPSPYFAIDFGLDFIGGRDFNGDRRSESAFTVNPILFLNPRNKVQIYLLAGLGLGRARIERPDGIDRSYRYVGADAGAGLEFRFWRRFALSADVLAFIRDRSDVGSSPPEYIDLSTRRFTDSSAGALLRLGGTYYW